MGRRNFAVMVIVLSALSMEAAFGHPRENTLPSVGYVADIDKRASWTMNLPGGTCVVLRQGSTLLEGALLRRSKGKGPIVFKLWGSSEYRRCPDHGRDLCEKELKAQISDASSFERLGAAIKRLYSQDKRISPAGAHTGFRTSSELKDAILPMSSDRHILLLPAVKPTQAPNVQVTFTPLEIVGEHIASRPANKITVEVRDGVVSGKNLRKGLFELELTKGKIPEPYSPKVWTYLCPVDEFEARKHEHELVFDEIKRITQLQPESKREEFEARLMREYLVTLVDSE